MRKTPRADMTGFTPCEADRLRNEKYEQRAAIERRARAAIVKGEKVYDRE